MYSHFMTFFFNLGYFLLYPLFSLTQHYAFLCFQEQAALEQVASLQTNKLEESPASNYRDKYSHLIGTSAAKDAAHTLEANSAYGCGECSQRPRDQLVSIHPLSRVI